MTPGQTVAATARVVAAGGVVVIPTDTVYGLACDPRSVAAVERIYAIKRRPAGLELSILAADGAACGTVGVVEGIARRLGEAFWPGPLSLVVPARAGAGLVIPRTGTSISVRVPASDALLELLRLTGPLASTSANRHGEPPCADAGAAAALLGPEVDAVLDGGPSAGRASTIIDCTANPPRVLRAGPLGPAELRPYLGG